MCWEQNFDLGPLNLKILDPNMGKTSVFIGSGCNLAAILGIARVKLWWFIFLVWGPKWAVEPQKGATIQKPISFSFNRIKNIFGMYLAPPKGQNVLEAEFRFRAPNKIWKFWTRKWVKFQFSLDWAVTWQISWAYQGWNFVDFIFSILGPKWAVEPQKGQNFKTYLLLQFY